MRLLIMLTVLHCSAYLLLYICSPPAVPTLSVFSAAISSTFVSNKIYTCRATIVIRRAGTTTIVNGATVSISWALLSSTYTGWPSTATPVTDSTGTAVSVSNRASKNNVGCRYTVTAVSAAGYSTLQLGTSVVRSINF
jgi:hypothetical protein